ncbi:hypothetical protein FQR65_LT18058 [Abscondita terminalis]|nr:hypothetical protein FQR65_LT18058 [Abscondita terminalis]
MRCCFTRRFEIQASLILSPVIAQIASEMDVEKLINAIRLRPPLWDQRSREYHDRDKVHKLWQEVAKEQNSTTDAAKKRWKSLRDVFRVELKKIPKLPSGVGTPSTFTSSWCHFESLIFLRDQMVPRQLTGNLPLSQVNEESDPAADASESGNVSENDLESQQQNSANENRDENVISGNHENDHETDRTQTEDTPGLKRPAGSQGKRNAKRKQEDFDIDRFLALEQEKIQLLKSTENPPRNDDEDYHFLMSFHPYLKEMRLETKMWFRLKMQELLYNCTVNEMAAVTSNTALPLFSPVPSTTSNSSDYHQL